MLYEKAWVHPAVQSGKVLSLGGVLTSVQEFARQVVGYFPAYVEFSDVAVTIARDDDGLLQCVLFHDKSDGSMFGRLIAHQLLYSFLKEFSDVDFSRAVHDTGRFAVFSSKIHDAIRHSVEAVLAHLSLKRGFLHAVVVYADGSTQAHAEAGWEMGLAANLQPLLTLSNGMLASHEDSPRYVYLETASKVVIVHRTSTGSLVSVCKKTVGSKESCRETYYKQTEEAVALLERGSLHFPLNVFLPIQFFDWLSCSCAFLCPSISY